MESLKRLEVGRLLSPKVLVSPTSPISKVVGILKDQNKYEVFIEQNGKIGIVTTRDILKVSNITTTKASSIAFLVHKLTPQNTVEEAAKLMMDYRIRALPVIENNSFIGEVQALSLITALRGNDFSKIKVKNIMTRNPICLSRNDLTSKARRLLNQKKIDHIPVLSDKKLSGIITSSHIVFNMLQATETIERSTILLEKQRKLEFPIKYVMDSSPSTSRSNNNISDILDEMIKLGTTYSIVTLWDEIHGIITYRDYMKLLSKQWKISNAQISIVGLPEDPFKAELVKSKFTSTILLLRKRFPFIEEAKSVIKTFSERGKQRQRYEVSISIVTPKRIFSYSEKGWDLPKIFDAISDKLKKMLSKKRLRRVSLR